MVRPVASTPIYARVRVSRLSLSLSLSHAPMSPDTSLAPISLIPPEGQQQQWRRSVVDTVVAASPAGSGDTSIPTAGRARQQPP